jgi:hypothetical protein
MIALALASKPLLIGGESAYQRRNAAERGRHLVAKPLSVNFRLFHVSPTLVLNQTP